MHEHTWLTQMFVFPDEPGVYEHDEPYEVQYCGDRDCGQRQTVLVSEDVAQEVRDHEGYTTEEVN
jgi:predicted GH43/DUF377 family glycosyl hydrolase